MFQIRALNKETRIWVIQLLGENLGFVRMVTRGRD